MKPVITDKETRDRITYYFRNPLSNEIICVVDDPDTAADIADLISKAVDK